MSPFLKVMQLFLMMTGTVLGMLLLLLVTPDLEDSMLRVVRRYNRRHHTDPVLLQTIRETVDGKVSQNGGGSDQGVLQDSDITAARLGLTLDMRRRFFTPWPNSEECNHYDVHFARKKSLPLTALVSFPGSGNTWLRYLLETSSGVFTGSVYSDRQIMSRGFYGEVVPPDCGCTSAQKTHGFALAGMVPPSMDKKKSEVVFFKGRGILLLRNPYDALLSYRNFLNGGHTGFAPYDRFRGQEWETFASRLAYVWRELAATWITYAKDATVVHFELLHNEPRSNLEDLLQFLRLPIVDKRMSCVLSHIDGPFHRPMSSQKLLFEVKDPFSEQLHKILDGVIDEVDLLLRKRGWRGMPTHLYKYYGLRGNHTRSAKLPPSP